MFSDPAVRHDYLVRHAESLVLGAWEDPQAFANTLSEVQYRTRRYGTLREVATTVLLVLSCDHGKDIIGRMRDVARSQFDGEGRDRYFVHRFRDVPWD